MPSFQPRRHSPPPKGERVRKAPRPAGQVLRGLSSPTFPVIRGGTAARVQSLRGLSNNADSRWLRPLLRPLLRVRMEGNLMAARAVGLAATGASLAASHAATSAKPIALLRKRRNAASAFVWQANASSTTPHGVIFTLKRIFLLDPARFFLLNPALTELAAVATDDGAPVGDGSPKGAVLALTADSAPGECLSVARYRFLHHTAVSFVSSDIRVFTGRRGTSGGGLG